MEFQVIRGFSQKIPADLLYLSYHCNLNQRNEIVDTHPNPNQRLPCSCFIYLIKIKLYVVQLTEYQYIKPAVGSDKGAPGRLVPYFLSRWHHCVMSVSAHSRRWDQYGIVSVNISIGMPPPPRKQTWQSIRPKAIMVSIPTYHCVQCTPFQDPGCMTS